MKATWKLERVRADRWLLAEFWKEEARQMIALLEYLQRGKVNQVGTSGGAWVAINAALEHQKKESIVRN